MGRSDLGAVFGVGLAQRPSGERGWSQDQSAFDIENFW